MKKPDLIAVKEWAKDMLYGGEVMPPPWVTYQYMKLIEAVDALTSDMKVPINSKDILTANSQQSARHRGSGLQLMADNDCQDNAPRR